jgi:mucin-2
VAGCGADTEPSADAPPAPNLTVPQTDPPTDPPETVDPGTETLPPETTPTTPDPATETLPPETTPTDTPTNDTPPPANSPAERFEDYCTNNPGACG